MTTKPTLKAALPKGNGLTIRLCDEIYDARAAGKPTDDLIVVGRLSPVGHGEEEGNRSVKFEFAALEVVAEEWERANVRDILTNASDKRHGATPLPMDWPSRNDDQQRRWLFGLIDEWQAEHELTDGEVRDKWFETFGIEPGTKDTPAGYAPVDYRQADAHKLREFALMVGVLAEDGSESGAADEGQKADTVPTATGDDPKCEVCSAQGVRLTDGLCDGCAKNAGVPVRGEAEVPA